MGLFKPGDRVRRIRGEHGGMVRGDEAVVVSQTNEHDLMLNDFTKHGLHTATNFELVEKAEEIINTYPIY